MSANQRQLLWWPREGKKCMWKGSASELFGTSLGLASMSPGVCALCAVTIGLTLGGCTDDCSHFHGFKVSSPDGEWTAQTHTEVCGGRVLALGSESTTVTLSRHKANYADLDTTVFSGSNIKSSELQLYWNSRYQLELSMPVHADIDALMASYEGIDISVRFVPPNPEERARWVDYKRKQAAALDESIERSRRTEKDASAAAR